MRTEALKSRMRELEWFHSLRALPATWIVLRVDGRSFSRLTEARFDKPFDPRFHELMVQVSTALLTELQGLFVLTQSDEASLLLPIAADLFDREVEKLVSLSASVATAAFSIGHGQAAHFDSRLWMGAKSELVVDYFRWRQADAARSCLNGWCYWTLRKNFNDLPAWQRCGTGVYFRSVTEQATNRKTGEPVSAVRRRVHVDEAMPHGKGLDTLLDGLLAS
jgi:tRNA(His) 5'-end guanylyltransferase